jgi:hypothetical protein
MHKQAPSRRLALLGGVTDYVFDRFPFQDQYDFPILLTRDSRDRRQPRHVKVLDGWESGA